MTPTRDYKEMVNAVANNCCGDTKDAESIINNGLDNCRDLLANGELDYDAMSELCCELGLEDDFIEILLEKLL